jgi:hypothetical protein
MKSSLPHELRRLLPAWPGCALLPMPALWLVRSGEGVAWRFCFLSVGCAALAAYAFRPEAIQKASQTKSMDRSWNNQMTALLIALGGCVAIFSSVCLALDDSGRMVSVCKAIYISILAACIVPYLTLITHKPFAAAVFSITLVFCMKLLGCIVVVLRYGWDADTRGYTTTPWTHPNLLVWFFLISTSLLSVALYFLGKRQFHKLRSARPSNTDETVADTGFDVAGRAVNSRLP